MFEDQQAGGPGQGAAAQNDDEEDNSDNVWDRMARQGDEANRFMQKELPQFLLVSLVLGIVLTIGTLLLLASGVLLLLNRPSGRVLCLMAAVIMIAGGIAYAAYGIGVQLPAAEKFDRMKEQEHKARNLPPPEAGQTQGLWIEIIATAIFSILYPGAAIAVMLSPGARRFYGRRGSDDEFDRYYGDDDYNEPRRGNGYDSPPSNGYDER
jgi:hypothetical protein